MTQPERPQSEMESGALDEPKRAELAARLWREHRGWVAGVIYAHMPRTAEADVDDLLQEVAVRLVRNIDVLDSPDAAGPWLRTVAINLARSAGRRHRRTQRIFQRFDGGGPEALPGRADDNSLDASSRGRAALEIAQSLPPHYREPLLLSLRGLSYKQIGRVLELPLSTIETRLSRARAMVRDELRAVEERDGAMMESEHPEPESLPLQPQTPAGAGGNCHE